MSRTLKKKISVILFDSPFNVIFPLAEIQSYYPGNYKHFVFWNSYKNKLFALTIVLRTVLYSSMIRDIHVSLPTQMKKYNCMQV